MAKSFFSRFSEMFSSPPAEEAEAPREQEKTPERLVKGITPREVEKYQAQQEAALYAEELNRREEDRINKRLAAEQAQREARSASAPAVKPKSKSQFDDWISSMEEDNQRKTG